MSNVTITCLSLLVPIALTPYQRVPFQTGTVLVAERGLFTALAFSPDGRFLAAVDSDRSLLLIDMNTRRPVHKSSGNFHQAVLTPDGAGLVTLERQFRAVRGTELKYWDLLTWKPQRSVFLPRIEIGLGFSRNGRLLAAKTTDRDRTVRVYDTATGKELVTFPDDESYAIHGAFSPVRNLLALGYHDGRVQLCDLATGRVRATLQKDYKPLEALAFSQDAKTLAVVWRDQMFLWDVESGKTRKLFLWPGHGVRSLAFSPDDKLLAVLVFANLVELWDLDIEWPPRLLRNFNGPRKGWPRVLLKSPQQAGIQAIAFYPDGKQLAGGGNGMIQLWQVPPARKPKK